MMPISRALENPSKPVSMRVTGRITPQNHPLDFLKTLKKGFGVVASVDPLEQPAGGFTGLSGPELMATDMRPPILYLRSFLTERGKATAFGRFSYLQSLKGGLFLMAHDLKESDSPFELSKASLSKDYKRKRVNSNRSSLDEQMLFAEYFSTHGPYVAIGRPGEANESMDLGAAKFYAQNEEWQDKVIELVNLSVAIVIEVDVSTGVSWEIREVLRRANPEKVLLLLPRGVADYEKFRAFSAELFPYPMPINLPKARLIMFGPGWLPIPINIASYSVEGAVKPFVIRIFGEVRRTQVR